MGTGHLHAGRSELARKAMSEHPAAGAVPLINHHRRAWRGRIGGWFDPARSRLAGRSGQGRKTMRLSTGEQKRLTALLTKALGS